MMSVPNQAIREGGRFWFAPFEMSNTCSFTPYLAVKGDTLLFGSPDTVRGKIEDLLEGSGCNYVIGSFAWGTLPMAAAERSLGLFAEHVVARHA